MTRLRWPLAVGVVAGAGCLSWAAMGASWRDAEGALAATACLPLSVSAACFLVAGGLDGAYRRALLWFSLALIGQAVTLQLIDAGHLLRYQHFPPLAVLAMTHPWLLACLGLQTLLVGGALARWGFSAARALAPAPGWRMLLALVLSAVPAATVSADPKRFVAELGFAATLQVLGLATIMVAVLAIPESALVRVTSIIDRAFGRDSSQEANSRRPDRFAWWAAGVAAVVAATLSVLSYERFPHVPDEVIYLLHARYFAAGMWTMPAPPVQAAFDIDLMTLEPTRWFSPVPPGWPAVLALGARIGVPWLVNPLLAGACVLLTYALLKPLYSQRVARYATALLAVSPWFLFLGMSYMTHMFTLTCALVGAVGVVRARASGSFVWGLVGGVGVGATSLIRPLDGLLVGILIALWALGAGGQRLRFAALTGLFLGTVATGAIQFPYNRVLTGDPLTFPINAYTDAHYGKNSNAYGFGPDRGLGWAIDPNPGHGPVDGIINTNLNVFGINTDLFGWSTGSLLLIAWLLCAGTLSRADRAMIAVVLAIVTGYFFYYFSGGPDFAARYWFPVIVPLVALTARGLETVERKTGVRAVVAVAALVIMSLVNYLPWRALDKYRHFRGMRADVRALAAANGFTGDLVLVRGARHPDYASASVENPLDLAGPATVYAWDPNPEVRNETLRAYPNRRVWIIDGPSRTGAGFKVVDGPLSAADLRARSVEQ